MIMIAENAKILREFGKMPRNKSIAINKTTLIIFIPPFSNLKSIILYHNKSYYYAITQKEISDFNDIILLLFLPRFKMNYS